MVTLYPRWIWFSTIDNLHKNRLKTYTKLIYEMFSFNFSTIFYQPFELYCVLKDSPYIPLTLTLSVIKLCFLFENTLDSHLLNMIIAFRKWTTASAALLPRRLSNFRAIGFVDYRQMGELWTLGVTLDSTKLSFWSTFSATWRTIWWWTWMLKVICNL